GGSVGQSIGLADGLLAIGAPYSDDGVAIFSGVVFLQEGDTTTPLAASDASGGAAFGHALAFSGERLVVGAPNVGRAYVFERTASGWQETAAFPAAAAGNGYAAAVALADDAAVI